jgi:hypothetical protein
MDFPSRDEARQALRLQAEPSVAPGRVTTADPARGAPAPVSGKNGPSPAEADNSAALEGVRFHVDKRGFESDVFDRRGIRNLIRTGAILETDPIRVDESGPVLAADIPYFKSLFKLARNQTNRPPTCCRTHTDSVAFFRCIKTGRPLCEDCAPEKRFGGQAIRVCQHCGENAEDLVPPA